MSQSSRVVAVIKRELKARQIAYRDVAARLGLSESAVKQMFSAGNFTLKRLDALCEILGLEFAELARLASDAPVGLQGLSVEQEERLVGDPLLLLVAYCVVNAWTFEEIVQRYKISETDCIRKLAQLDRMKMAELLPGNRIRVLIGINFQWQPNGPIEQFFRNEVQNQFFDSAFDGHDAVRLVKSGDITELTFRQLVNRIQSAGQLFDDLAREDHAFDSQQRRGTSMILAIRHWEFGAFKSFERQTR
ncbi:MAG: helix-turn-helix domain-containing protein [Granulosicoccus sp.]